MFGTRSARCGQLLLFAALLFGIFTMHTVGHPAEPSGRGATGTAASHSMAAAATGVDAMAMDATDTTAASRSGRSERSEAKKTTDATETRKSTHLDHPRHDRPAPMRGMDPMAVCLAVLSVWGLALLTALMVARRPVDRVPGTSPAREPWRPRPPPPPRPRMAVLTGLSVLRI
ncbi:hypothetical protein ACFV6Z_10605 [Streptomyces sp. NPDC059818]|uniref:hypothetical protein n=1 Tax=Streptomyces sp. NPDC059818 TaxID=3346962 RepID=UPI00365026D4